MDIVKYLPSATKIVMALLGFALLIAIGITLYGSGATKIGAAALPETWVSIATAFVLIGIAILNDAPKIEAVATDLVGVVDHTTPLAQMAADFKAAVDGLPLAISSPLEALLPAHTAAVVAGAAQAVTDALAASNALGFVKGASAGAGSAFADVAKVAEVLDPSNAPAIAAAAAAINDTAPIGIPYSAAGVPYAVASPAPAAAPPL